MTAQPQPVVDPAKWSSDAWESWIEAGLALQPGPSGLRPTPGAELLELRALLATIIEPSVRLAHFAAAVRLTERELAGERDARRLDLLLEHLVEATTALEQRAPGRVRLDEGLRTLESDPAAVGALQAAAAQAMVTLHLPESPSYWLAQADRPDRGLMALVAIAARAPARTPDVLRRVAGKVDAADLASVLSGIEHAGIAPQETLLQWSEQALAAGAAYTLREAVEVAFNVEMKLTKDAAAAVSSEAPRQLGARAGMW